MFGIKLLIFLFILVALPVVIFSDNKKSNRSNQTIIPIEAQISLKDRITAFALDVKQPTRRATTPPPLDHVQIKDQIKAFALGEKRTTKRSSV